MKQIIKKTPINEYSLFSPLTVHLELTNACNIRCRHCYNFWREDTSPCKIESLDKEKLDELFRILEEHKVMHIILTGGEPALNYKGLLYAAKKATKLKMSTSLNSNMISLNYKQLVELKSAGLQHILTTLNSYDEKICDEIASVPGTYKKIIRGIKNAVKAGIKISVNLIVSKKNIDDIYMTGKLCENLGVNAFFANRTVPPLTKDINLQKEYWVLYEEAEKMIKSLKSLEQDTTIKIGTLRTIPICSFGDIEEYGNLWGFMGRGCLAGNRMICINVNGDCHACVHEVKSYGNVYRDGLKKVWENMKKWRGEYFPQECQQCIMFDECNSGCRVVAEAYFGKLSEFDNLRNRNNLIKFKEMFESYHDKIMDKYQKEIKTGKFRFSKNLRIRKEKGFYSVNIWGASTIFINDKNMELYFRFKDKEFTLSDAGAQYKNHLASFLRCELIKKC